MFRLQRVWLVPRPHGCCWQQQELPGSHVPNLLSDERCAAGTHWKESKLLCKYFRFYKTNFLAYMLNFKSLLTFQMFHLLRIWPTINHAGRDFNGLVEILQRSIPMSMWSQVNTEFFFYFRWKTSSILFLIKGFMKSLWS